MTKEKAIKLIRILKEHFSEPIYKITVFKDKQESTYYSDIDSFLNE